MSVHAVVPNAKGKKSATAKTKYLTSDDNSQSDIYNNYIQKIEVENQIKVNLKRYSRSIDLKCKRQKLNKTKIMSATVECRSVL